MTGVEPHPDLAALAAAVPPGSPTSRCWSAPPRPCRCPTPRSTSCTRGGPTSSVPGASPGCRARPRGTPRRYGVRRRQRRHPVDLRRWFRRGYPTSTPTPSSGSGRGTAGQRTPVDIEWRFDAPGDLEAVVRIEFDPVDRGGLLAEHGRVHGRLRGRRGRSILWWPTLTHAHERRAHRSLGVRMTSGSRSARTQPVLEQPDDLDRHLLERLPHRGQAGRTWAASESSKPTTATSSGRRAAPRSAIAWSTPIATVSLTHTNAVGLLAVEERVRRAAGRSRWCPRRGR